MEMFKLGGEDDMVWKRIRELEIDLASLIDDLRCIGLTVSVTGFMSETIEDPS